MRIWRFYLKPEKNSERKKYELYAITNNKVYAKKFMEERDMNKFIHKTSKEPKEAYIEFANNNLSLVLGMHKYATKTINEKKEFNTTIIEVLSTEYEHQCCDSDTVMIDILDQGEWNYAPPYNIYKKKILKALYKLEYVSSYKVYRLDFDNSFIDPKDDDYSAPNIWIDEFGLFVRTFGGTFKI